jgi:pyruvate kinase
LKPSKPQPIADPATGQSLPRRAKIICTIGPACNTEAVMRDLLRLGMDIARLNFSHGTHEDHAQNILRLRRAAEREGRTVCILQDLQGPKIRTGPLERHESVLLKTGSVVTITPQDIPGAATRISTTFPDLARELTAGARILLSDGLIELRVRGARGKDVLCDVINGGMLGEHKGINLPGIALTIPALTEKDRKDLEFGLNHGVDAVALSFVRTPADVSMVKQIIAAHQSDVPVIAKLEKPQAIDHLEEILEVADGVMVARGDLGVEMAPEKVPVIQKHIIRRASAWRKPVITATQMLESMIHHPEPTRAEASDVANAILDGTSAVMLSGETAMGEYPVQAVQTMDRISRAVEPSLGYRHQIPEATEDPTIGNAMSNAACDLAEALGAAAILVPTFTGRTASAVARLRPRRPIVALTHKQWSVHQMAIEWGVTPIWIPECKDVEDLWNRSMEAAAEAGLIETGDTVVITAGTAVNIPGSTNVIKVDVL